MGTTTHVDLYFYQKEMSPLVQEVGMRGVLGESVIDFPWPNFHTPNETLVNVGVLFLQEWQGNELVTPCVSPRAPYITSPWIYSTAWWIRSVVFYPCVWQNLRWRMKWCTSHMGCLV